MDNYDLFLQQRKLQIKFEKKTIGKIGIVAGLCITLSSIIQVLIGSILLFQPIRQTYINSEIFQSCFIIISSVLGVAVPFGLGGLYLRDKTKTDIFKFNKPNKISLSVTAVPFGFFICLIANYVTGIFVTVCSKFGVTLSSPQTDIPSGFIGRFAYFVSIAVIPPLVEELALRGVVMQPLRKFGDGFAIVVSSAVFAILHGNLIQAPFAFIAGLGIGYAVCITESLWTGVFIHFANNLYSVASGFLEEDIKDIQQQNLIYYIALMVLLAVSIIGSVEFMIIKGKQKLGKTVTAMSNSQKAASFFINPAMIIAILIMITVTLEYIKFK